MTMSCIILDRDGVINQDSADYIKSPAEWHAIPGSLEAVARLNRAGFRVVIATNQSGIARGYYDVSMLDLIHEKMRRELAAVGGYVDEIFFCPHHPDEGCYCRKPKPGLLFDIRDKYKLNLADTFFIGDSHVDVQAARLAGCPPLLVMTGKGCLTREQYPDDAVIPYFADLTAAVDYVISEQRK